MKTKIAIVLILIASVAMFSTGAFAYFTSTRTITGSQISAGTLNLQLANGDCATAAYGETALAWNFTNLAPGEFVEQKICMKNIGSVAAGQVIYDWSDLLQTPEGVQLAKQLIIVDIQDNADGANQAGALATGYGIHTLYDLAEFGPGTPGWDAYSGNIYPFIPASGSAWLYMKLQFNTEADDTFQGSAVTYKLTIKAVQNKVY
jgi:predicted ribosomally synthesized peptide with SipW-like signal peptide